MQEFSLFKLRLPISRILNANELSKFLQRSVRFEEVCGYRARNASAADPNQQFGIRFKGIVSFVTGDQDLGRPAGRRRVFTSYEHVRAAH